MQKNIRAGYGAEKLRSWLTFLQGGHFHLPQRFYSNNEQHLSRQITARFRNARLANVKIGYHWCPQGKTKQNKPQEKENQTDFPMSLEKNSSENTGLGFSETSAYEFQNQFETQTLQSGRNK